MFSPILSVLLLLSFAINIFSYSQNKSCNNIRIDDFKHYMSKRADWDFAEANGNIKSEKAYNVTNGICNNCNDIEVSINNNNVMQNYCCPYNKSKLVNLYSKVDQREPVKGNSMGPRLRFGIPVCCPQSANMIKLDQDISGLRHWDYCTNYKGPFKWGDNQRSESNTFGSSNSPEEKGEEDKCQYYHGGDDKKGCISFNDALDDAHRAAAAIKENKDTYTDKFGNVVYPRGWGIDASEQ